MVDWGYKSIYRNLTKEQVSEIYESKEFWSSVKPNEILMKALEDSEEDEQGIWQQYNWILLTKGSKESLQKKLDYLNKIPFFAPIPLPTIIATGVARPRAQGQLITKTDIPLAKANPLV